MCETAHDTTPETLPAVAQLGRFIATVSDSHGDIALARSRRAVLDTIGCMLIGSREPAARLALATVLPWGRGEAAVVGTDARLPPPWAALVNGSAAKAFDFDDWDDEGLTHTTAVLLPALMAAFADGRASGRALFDAHIVGVEAIMKIGEAVNPIHYDKGWHATSTVGALGAAAACARALGLDPEQSAHAISLATSMAGGFTSQFGTMVKPMHAGIAAKAGLVAASLAGQGVMAHPDALEGPVGFVGTMSDATSQDLGQALSRLGDPWAIVEHGLHIKLYPSCGGTHRVVEAALALRRTHGLVVEDIERVEINVPDYLSELLPYGVPEDANQALFSFAYCVAAALVCGRLGVREFTEEVMARQDIRDLASRVETTTRVVPSRSRVFLAGDFDTVTIVTKAGLTLSAGVDVPQGAPPKFADDEAVEEKFFTCAAPVVSRKRADGLRDLILRSDGDWKVSDLTALLRVGPADPD